MDGMVEANGDDLGKRRGRLRMRIQMQKRGQEKQEPKTDFDPQKNMLQKQRDG